MNRPATDGAGSPPRQWRRFAVVVGLVCLLTLAISMPAIAQSDGDTEAPTLADAQRGDATTIVVTVADDTDVDESTISQSDFALSTGLLGNATVNESGSNATVELTLVDKVDADNVTVSLVGSISDSAGNTVSGGAATATGMDGRNPRLQDFAVTRINGTHGRITVDTSERLSGLSLALGGANPGNLDERNFTETVRGDGTVRYERSHAFPEEGVSSLLLMDVTDEAGNSVGYNARRTYLTDRTPPTAGIEGPVYVTTGDTHTFESGATDNVGVESVSWSLGNDTTRAGTSISHTFTEPGNRTLTVTVADGRNHTATARHNVTVVAGASKDGVSVTPVASNRTNATVFDDRAADRVRIADREGRLVSADGIGLESVTATPAANESLHLRVSVASEARAFTTATDRRSIGSFTLNHSDRTGAENVTFEFAVERSQLRAVGLAPEDVSLYRLHDNWTELPTRVQWRGNDTIRFRADSPGLSTFAIGASEASETAANETTATDTETATPSGTEQSAGSSDGSELVVSRATLVDTTVTAGEHAIVDVVVENRGTTAVTDTVALTANDSVRTRRTVTVPAGDNRSLQFATRVDGPTEFAVDGTVAGVVTVVSGDPDGATGDDPTASATPTPTATGTVESAQRETQTTTDGDGGGIPNPFSLWPDGIVGTAIAGLVAFVAVAYGVLKGIAIYLGY